MRIAVLASSAGGVLDGLCKVLHSRRWPYQIVGVITDRPCGAEDIASTHAIPLTRIVDADPDQWCTRAAEHLTNLRPDAVLLLINRKVDTPIWRDLNLPVLNLHPSLLPAYPGLNALQRNFADAQLAASRGEELRMGATIHLVNEVIDGGPIISQRYFTIDDAPTLQHAQHICYLYKIALVLECVCKYMDGTLPRLQDTPTDWDWIANYALWQPYEPIVEVQTKLAEPWAVEWLKRKVHEGAARLVRKVLHA